MANYHCDVKIQGRSGSAKFSAVRGASYRSGEELYDERLKQNHSFQNRHDVNASEIMLPIDDAPEWAQDRQQLWNEVERIEDKSTRRATAQVYRDVLLTLPREFTLEENQELVRSWVQKEFVSKGLVADVAWHGHDDNHNPHAHIMLTTRTMNADGFSAKKATAFDGYRQFKNDFGNHPFEEQAEQCCLRRQREATERWEVAKKEAEEKGKTFGDRKPSKPAIKMVMLWRPSWEDHINSALDDADTGLVVSCLPKHLQEQTLDHEVTGVPIAALEIEERKEGASTWIDEASFAETANSMRDQIAGFEKELDEVHGLEHQDQFVDRMNAWWGNVRERVSSIGHDLRSKWDNLFESAGHKPPDNSDAMEMGE